MARMLMDPPPIDDKPSIELIFKHGHQDLVQAVAFNSYGDRCATGSVDGKIRVFNRHRDGVWRHCDTWGAHGGEILELQWLPPTIYPNLLASLGIEGRFKIWAEDPSAAPGRRFSSAVRGVSTIFGPTGPISSTIASQRSASGSSTSSGDDKSKPLAAFETRNSRSPYRSFSLKHFEDTRYTYLALASADGRLTVYENEQPENLGDWTQIDEFPVLSARPARGEETAFRVRFDPNAEVCYTALRAGVPMDALGLVVAAMDSVKIYRTRDTVSASLGLTTAVKEFYLAAEVVSGTHRGLVRDVAWAPGNIRGYDIIATACQDGFVRVFSLTTPTPTVNIENEDDDEEDYARYNQENWTTADVLKKHQAPSAKAIKRNKSRLLAEEHKKRERDQGGIGGALAADGGAEGKQQQPASPQISQQGQQPNSPAMSHHSPSASKSGIRAGLDMHTGRSGTSNVEGRRSTSGQPGHIRHVITEISKLDSHRTPVWRVGFDDDGQILGSVGDEGKLMCYRQTPDGTWAKSSELTMLKMRMAAP
ncbi:WD40-repeat-containing domain protein [Diplogelasinospora grovesii]|uniref:WD40-repeat-containing domain protein n=1 Tax=Diplogelasinospora grovesii TaxID=303347 RepID=A0AAN6S8Z2_9PEZI|nr:WD40-repeat-containing domain protein [Diplogelasinospora grovesii]